MNDNHVTKWMNEWMCLIHCSLILQVIKRMSKSKAKQRLEALANWKVSLLIDFFQSWNCSSWEKILNHQQQLLSLIIISQAGEAGYVILITLLLACLHRSFNLFLVMHDLSVWQVFEREQDTLWNLKSHFANNIDKISLSICLLLFVSCCIPPAETAMEVTDIFDVAG